MKLVTLETGGVRHIGALLPGELEAVDFTASNTALYFRDMLALIDGGAAALDHARSLLASPPRVTPLTQARLLEPLPEPRQMRDCLVFVARKRSRAARDARRKADALQSGQDHDQIMSLVRLDQSEPDKPRDSVALQVEEKPQRRIRRRVAASPVVRVAAIAVRCTGEACTLTQGQS